MSLVEKHLVGPTTYQDYTTRWLGPIEELPNAMQKRYTQLEIKIASKLKDGDELWEWNTSSEDEDGGTSGLAVVREGKVIESWVCWTS
ncbi:MAG: hypothetical protein ACFCD0_02315 [Gemmataceae bacterium]